MAQRTRRRSGPLSGVEDDLRPYRLESGLALLTAGLGALSLAVCFVEPLHALAAWTGAAGLVTGTVAQMLSVNLTQRWLTVLGWVAAFIGLLIAVGNGGFT